MILDDSTFLIYAAKHYDMKTAASADDFYEDLKRFQHLRRLFKRYHEDGDLRVRLILNHLIVIYNCFGSAATNMLYMRLEEYHTYLKPFVVFLNFMPNEVEYKNKKIPTSEISLDINIVKELRKI